MANKPTISHKVNGYSRYDVPESKAFSCTPGILYPVRIQFVNARDRVRIAQGIDVRSNPLSVPTFNPYSCRLHRFFVPMQLYHPEMRVNASKFDMNNISLNWIPTATLTTTATLPEFISSAKALPNSLLAWLRAANTKRPAVAASIASSVALNESVLTRQGWANADTYLAYWDIVRNYYAFSQWSVYSFAWPASWKIRPSSAGFSSVTFDVKTNPTYFTQAYGNLEYLDAYYESQFYPGAVTSSNNTYNRWNLFKQIMLSDLQNTFSVAGDGFPVIGSSDIIVNDNPINPLSPATPIEESRRLTEYFLTSHPLAVVPSSPDRLSRTIPNGSAESVSISAISTVSQLAVASRLQEYKDLLGAGGSRFSDWLETFFASKIDHVDRPKLLFSTSVVVNSQVIMNQSGSPEGSSTLSLGQQGGSIAFNTTLGKPQSYYFSEPGYIIDMMSIRPVYYWAGVKPDYLSYKGADYFNPVYNDIGYQSVPADAVGAEYIGNTALGLEPVFNEFRASYDEVLGSLSVTSPAFAGQTTLLSSWVQQRSGAGVVLLQAGQTTSYPALFVDMAQVNAPFATTVEDNFFVNLSYSVQQKNLVNKTFATRLANR